ncbi:hypothetical protein POM88_043786 [Heracleum sosnowskyi]|uniref:Uncharacterized protein n=1 Tax=Heracleum sosnowskyi TaxID=360622 RepID=A0AAD8M4L1_9APIA|nr:hypothetical protein POM88_043786 [Heracleum sosnowskyi]
MCKGNKTNMYVCYEEKDGTGNHSYVIYSVNMADLMFGSCLPLRFTREASIVGVPFMGCGIFGTKVVLAGGLLQLDKAVYEKDHPVHETHKAVYVKNKGVITYDIITKQVSTIDIPDMRGGKVKPLVFEVNKRLYVLDTNGDLSGRSFEVYYPKQKQWHQVVNPYFHRSSPYIVPSLSFQKGLRCFSWFVFGDCICISLPNSMLTYLHHTKYMLKSFEACFSAPLPFSGMAITYCHPDFEDSVLISFHKGLVEGRRLRMSFYGSYEEPVLIFDTKTHGDMSGFFTGFGKRRFCLTVFDNAKIRFYTFKIVRLRNQIDDKLNLKLQKLNLREFHHAYFNLNMVTTFTSFSFAGCYPFVPAGCDWGWGEETVEAGLHRRLSRLRACNRGNFEAALYCYKFPLSMDEIRDDDIPGTKCIHLSDDEEDSLDLF